MITLLSQHQLLILLLVGLISIQFYLRKLERIWQLSINDIDCEPKKSKREER